jgi:hypothetical protein
MLVSLIRSNKNRRDQKSNLFLLVLLFATNDVDNQKDEMISILHFLFVMSRFFEFFVDRLWKPSLVQDPLTTTTSDDQMIAELLNPFRKLTKFRECSSNAWFFQRWMMFRDR